MVKSGFRSKYRVKVNVGGAAELSEAVQVLSQIGGKGFCLQQKNTNTNEFDVQIQTKIKTNPCLHHVLLGELVLLNEAHVILVCEVASSNEPFVFDIHTS